jgi:voltage-gated potassium channel
MLLSVSTTAMPKSAIAFVTDLAPYQFFMLVLCVWSLAILGAESFFHLDAATTRILDHADNFVCVLFFADFVYSFTTAPRKARYMATWGWIDLLSSIPMIDAFRLGRFARVMRILRVLRGVKSARAIAQFAVAKREESALLAAVLLCLLLIVCGSIAILQFEVPAGGNITSAEDAMWWAITTMTTVGYGDRFPISTEGRLVAVCLMAAGVGIFGTLSGLVAAWFLSPSAREADSDLAEIKRSLAELRAQIAAGRAGDSAPGSRRDQA